MILLVVSEETATHDVFYGCPGSVAEDYDHVGVRVDAVSAVVAAEYGLGDKVVSGVAGSWIEFGGQAGPASRAGKPLVELLLGTELLSQNVLISFRCTPSQLRIHLFEDAHAQRVAECPPH